MTNELLDTRGGNTLQEFLDQGKIIRKPQEMANLQINHYESKINLIIQKLPKSDRNPLRYLEKAFDKWDQSQLVPKFNFNEITLEETGRLVASLANSSSFGHDGLDVMALKSGGSGLLKPLQHLINTSL